MPGTKRDELISNILRHIRNQEVICLSRNSRTAPSHYSVISLIYYPSSGTYKVKALSKTEPTPEYLSRPFSLSEALDHFETFCPLD